MYQKKVTILSLVVLLSLMLSLVFPTSALADDNLPPPPETPEEVIPSEEVPADEGTANEEPAVTEETTPTDIVVPDVLPDATSPEVTADTGAAENDIPLLGQLPEGTDVVVLDENGDAVSLASQDAAEILALPDPRFCPGVHVPGDTECWEIRTTIQAAVNDAKTAGVAGTVYIQSGTFTEIVTIADFAYALTLQGVFSLAPYVVLTDPANRPVINGRILIQDGGDSGTIGNTANITLADLIINNSDTTTNDDPAVFANANTADLTFINLDINAATNSNGGLMVQGHSGNVFLSGVDISGTDEYGASITNTTGSGTVTVSGSVFNDNDTDGLRIYSNGAVNLDNVTANINLGNGVYIENQTSTTNAGVNITGSNTFNGNRNTGLYVRSKGAITLSNITALGSATTVDSGVWLDNDETGATAGVTITGSNNVFSGNNDYGLMIDSRGAISLANITAENNRNDAGVSIENCNWNGSVCLGSGDVTLTGVLRFINNGNDDDGLVINSGGNVSMADVTAADNGDEGVQVNNTYSAASATVQVLGTNNIFTGNSGDGLNISSDGNITLNNITADANLDDGAEISNVSSGTNATVTLTFTPTGTVTTNSFSGNTSDGLLVTSKGAIELWNITANNNVNDNGVVLDNDETGAMGGVTINGDNNTFNGNDNSGLSIVSKGAVSLDNITADGNETAIGVSIDNCRMSGGVCLGSGDITLTGTLVFTNNGNDDDGLNIYTRGNVFMADVIATGNKSDGVEINNTPSSASATVQIGGTNVFTGNTGTGLLIYSDGAVSLNNVTADTNTGGGGRIENQTSTTPASVTLTVTDVNTDTNSFDGNRNNGLYVRSKGTITLSNVTADGSTTLGGAYLDNEETGAVGGVTLIGSNSFSGNDDYGLQIYSLGAVGLNNLTADNNVTQFGANIFNAGTGASGDVTIAGTNSFSGNDDYGLRIDSKGAVSLENVTADGNKTEDGVYIDNAAGTGDVTLTGTQTFTNNGNGDGDDGLYIRTQGNVALGGVIATGNKDEGVEIDNTPSSNNTSVQIGGTNVFTGNSGTGLLIYSDGAVSLNNVTASTNGTTTTTGHGVYIENQTSTGTAGVTITGSNVFNGNRNNGLYVRSKGAITLSDITAVGSATTIDSGVWLDNDETNAAGGVTITGPNNVFSSNNDYGLGIYSRGAVSLENITASGNRLEDGVFIDNAAGTGTVTLNGILSFTNNGNDGIDDGLYVRTQSSLTLENVTATGNKDEGVEIDNTPGTGSATVTGGTFNQNLGDGLYIRSDGLITLVDVTANQNGDDGADISNDTGGSVAGANIFVVRSTFNDNGDDGLLAASNLDVTLINVTAQNNRGDGVELYSDGDNVIICGGGFGGNNFGGVGTDYDVRATGTRYRSSAGVAATWSPSTGWNDGTSRCSSYPDMDGDLLPNAWDTDDDNDGILDGIDACPVGASTGTDTDGDGCKDTEDDDDDGDGVLDTSDSCPIGASTGTDTDGDGCKDTEDDDDDGDGVLDGDDAFPLDSNEWVDTDGDGVGNNADTDDDNDGVLDVNDAFPLDPTESIDTDGDGTGNNKDRDDNNNGISDLWERRMESKSEKLENPPLDILIPVTGGQASALSCPFTTLEVAGFQVTFGNLCGYSAVLAEAPENGLPGTLPDGSKFVGGINITLLQDGSSVSPLPADTSTSYSFELPSGMSGENLAILYWDPTANGGAGGWVEKSVTVVDGKATLAIDMPGTFVLVSK